VSLLLRPGNLPRGDLAVICICSPSKDLKVEAIGGYYFVLDSVERIGPAELREGRIWSPREDAGRPADKRR